MTSSIQTTVVYPNGVKDFLVASPSRVAERLARQGISTRCVANVLYANKNLARPKRVANVVDSKPHGRTP